MDEDEAEAAAEAAGEAMDDEMPPPGTPGAGSAAPGSAGAEGGTAGGGSGAATPKGSPGASGAGAQGEEINPTRALGRPDTLNSEFMYYSSVLKLVAPTLTNELDKQKVLPWIKKLFRPEYHSIQFREKRNKYLLFLTVTLLNDEAYSIFQTIPPDGKLPDLTAIEIEEFPAAEWEMDSTWKEYLDNLPEDFQSLSCPIHESLEDCNADHSLDTILDQEFHFLLYLLKPYAALMPNVYDRTRVATWMQTLCSVTGDACSSLRGIRNDYIMALLGYVQNLRLIGPFAEYPPIRTLPSLAEAAQNAADARPITDPSGPDAADFMAMQQIPEDGAFCYIALTGDLISSNVSSEAAGATAAT